MDALSAVARSVPQGAVPLRYEYRKRPLKICFVAPTAYAVLARSSKIREVGGAEVQQSILARELARRGNHVSMICHDYGQGPEVEIDGVKVLRAHTPDGGLPGLRFFHPRLTSVWSAMRRADADVYYQRTAGALTGIVLAFANMHRRHFVFAAGSDRDFLARLPHIRFARDRVIYRWALRNSHLIIAQTPEQRRLCIDNFNRNATIIPSCYRLEGRSAIQEGPIIWVGNILPVKRAHLFIQVARKLPQFEFKLVGGASGEVLSELRRSAATLKNLEFCGFVPFSEIDNKFDGASILVNTSTHEGFPNTFLQAWARGMPTVSFFDPKMTQSGTDVACVVESVAEMAALIHDLKRDPHRWSRQSELVRAFFTHHFDVNEVVDTIESEIDDKLLNPRIDDRPGQ